MSSPKVRLGVIFGGKSAEHEISLISAKSIIESLDKEKYDVSLIGIDKAGGWHLRDSKHFLQHTDNPKLIQFSGDRDDLAFIPNPDNASLTSYTQSTLQNPLRLDEEAIVGRELECAVLGNEDPMASLPGELVPNHEFYSYEAKYLDDNGARFEIPVQLGEAKTKELQKLAIEAFKVLCCEGMARVDFFMRENGELLINEINTIPGFTKISLYPKLWEASGLSYSELLDRLIQLAQERHENETTLKTAR